MNFYQAKQNTGCRTEINAKIIKVWPEDVTKGGKRKQPIDVSDGATVVKVTSWINANYPAMTSQEYEGKECQWVVTHSIYQNKDQYSGWPTNKPNTQPLSQPAPQPTYQAPQYAQPAPQPEPIICDDPVQVYIVRQSSIKASVELLKGGTAGVEDIIDTAELFVEYVFKGKPDMNRRIDDIKNDPF